MNNLQESGHADWVDIKSRVGLSGITAVRLEAVWPQVSRRLGRLLYRRGLDASQRDDVIQEVAARVLAARLPFESADELYAWAAPVARNLHVDLLRAGQRTTDAEHDLAGLPGWTDVEHEVERRLVLEDTLRAIATLGTADRQAILEPMAVGDRRVEAGRVTVRRHRARQRLRVMLKGTLGWAALLRLGRRPERVLVPAATSGALLAPALLVAVLPLGPGWSPETRREAPRTSAPVVRRLAAPERAVAPARRPAATAVTAVVAAATRPATAGPARAPDEAREIAVLMPDGDNGARVDDKPAPDDRIVCVEDMPVTGTRRCVQGSSVPVPDAPLPG